MIISGKGRVESVEYSSAAEEIAGNEDLLREILFRLPVKSLLRFVSVSKKWFSLISHPYFTQNYSRRRNPNFQPSGLLVNDEYAGFQFVPFNDNGNQSRVSLSYSHEVLKNLRISQSCNGLLICHSTIFVGYFNHYLCNPTTKQFTAIPYPNPAFKVSVVSINLAFDPFKSPHYKLLCIRKVHGQNLSTYRAHLYSSESGFWRNPISADPLIFTAPNSVDFNCSVYCNGAIHWYSDGDTSLYFNTHTERLKPMPMWPLRPVSDYPEGRYFGESRGHLLLIVIEERSAMEFDILELKTDYSGWFIRYHVDLNAVTSTLPEIIWNHDELFNPFSVLCVARAEKEEESTLVLFISGKVISFDLHKKTSKKLCDLAPRRYEWFDAYQYIETLFRFELQSIPFTWTAFWW